MVARALVTQPGSSEAFLASALMAQGALMVARALVTHPGSSEAFLGTLMLCSDGSRDVHVSVGTLTPTGRSDMLLTCRR